MKPVDSHCHLQFEQFEDDREDVIKDIQKNLDFVVLAGCSPEDNQKVLEIASSFSQIKYCLGVHPLYCENVKIEEVEKQIGSNEPCAVGEIGLDYNYITDKDSREYSEKVFRDMLEIAENYGLGVVIHSRNAERKCFEIVEEYDVQGFFHCFNGEPELAKEISSKGHFIGVTNQVFYSSRVQNIVGAVDLEHIMTETDSPYLGGEDRNTPLAVLDIVKRISEIKDLDSEKVCEVTTENSRQFFG